MSLLIQLIESLSFLLLAALILSLVAPWIERRRPVLRQCVVGGVFAAAGLCSMASPFVLQPGVVIDSRNVVALLAGPIGGPLAALVTAVPLAAMRYANGGLGMPSGLAGIVLNALAGAAYVVWLSRRRRTLVLLDFVALSMLGVVCLLASVLFMPSWSVAERFLREAVPIMIAMSTVGTVLVGYVIHRDRERRETAYRFKTLIRRAPGTLYQRIVRPDGTLAYHFASFGIDKLLGVTKEEVERDPEVWLGRMLPEDRARFEAARAVPMRPSELWRFEGRCRGADGAIVWLRSEATMRELPDGSTAWDGILLDVTGEKTLELRRQEVEDQRRSALDELAGNLEVTVGQGSCRMVGLSVRGMHEAASEMVGSANKTTLRADEYDTGSGERLAARRQRRGGGRGDRGLDPRTDPPDRPCRRDRARRRELCPQHAPRCRGADRGRGQGQRRARLHRGYRRPHQSARAERHDRGGARRRRRARLRGRRRRGQEPGRTDPQGDPRHRRDAADIRAAAATASDAVAHIEGTMSDDRADLRRHRRGRQPAGRHRLRRSRPMPRRSPAAPVR